ncbi:DUF3038 domain-containing protein [Oscillatoria sp. FACHB-1406]|uniref:DUF3038 domain-containing protein n=1 Tax=Oscillatoria sp. FACHB-1406 TaxID=2692846 RepID=UPI001689DFE5|nr:DUF3038 domain-containing protein [Oscillatoria sp. FACHB-1406]MBD2578213.1 DUF3038 domain-containing protein [Oscillatoria sp. FACHB-1406]
MNDSASAISNGSSSALSKPYILENLPNPPLLDEGCSLRVKQRLDLILLALESLELGASEKMLAAAKELELDEIVKHRVVLWNLRRTNPWRRSRSRSSLSIDEAKALTIIACSRARQLTVSIRQLLLAEQQMRDKRLPLEQHFRLSEYLERFRAHFRSRMNPRRARVAAYNADDRALNELALVLLNQLLFCTGTAGTQRFWIGLFDGEVR